MTDETTTKNLVAAVAERDRRIAELAQALLDSADKVDAAVSAAVAAERKEIKIRLRPLYRWRLDGVDGLFIVGTASDVLSAIDAIGGAP